MLKDYILDYHARGYWRRRSLHDSNQRMVCVKIDKPTMVKLDKEVAASGVPRNRLINMAIEWYLMQLDDARLQTAED